MRMHNPPHPGETILEDCIKSDMQRLEEGILDQAFGRSDKRPADQSGEAAEPPGS